MNSSTHIALPDRQLAAGRERAITNRPLQLRQDTAATTTGIAGYAAVYYDGTPETQYQIFEDLYERIMPGAFDRALAEQQDVRCTFNHDDGRVLARSSAGDLRLTTDATGLAYEADADPDDPDWQSTLAKIRRRNVIGSSFEFSAVVQQWRMENDIEIRELLDVDLYAVNPVTWPAYTATTAYARGAYRAAQHPDRLAQLHSRGRLAAAIRRRDADQLAVGWSPLPSAIAADPAARYNYRLAQLEAAGLHRRQLLAELAALAELDDRQLAALAAGQADPTTTAAAARALGLVSL